MSFRISDNVRAEAGRRGLRTNAQLGERIGLSQRSVSRRMVGETPWTADELLRVARVLGVDVATLYAGVEPTTATETGAVA